MKKLAFIMALICAVSINLEAKAPAKAPAKTPGKLDYKVIPADSLKTVSFNTLVYSLPKTILCTQVTAQKTTEIRGPFYQYSERYLGLKDVVTENKTTWELLDVEILAKGTPDDNKRFAIMVGSQGKIPALCYADNGCISAINANGSKPEQIIEKEITLGEQNATFDFVPYTEEMLVANSTAKMAAEAANFIKRIRENRTLLISGESSISLADGKAFELALNKMDELERQYIELFKGKIIYEVVEESIPFLPNGETTRELLFRFSKFKGIVDKTDLSGEPVNMALELMQKHALPNATPEKQYDSKGRLIKDIPDAGIYYNMPALSKVTLNYGGETIYTNQFKIAQLGQLLNLPQSVIYTKGIRFDSSTGAIISIQ